MFSLPPKTDHAGGWGGARRVFRYKRSVELLFAFRVPICRLSDVRTYGGAAAIEP